MKNVSLSRAMKHDYTLYVALLTIIVSVFVNIINYAFQGAEILYPFLAITTLGIILFIVRYKMIKTIFNNARLAEGVVTQISFFKSRGRITVSYFIEDEEYNYSGAIVRTSETKNIRVNDPLNLIVDTRNLNKALLVDLYTDSFES